MTREMILKKLRESKKKGIGYKYIAEQAGISVRDLYEYSRDFMKVHIALEEYFNNQGEEK